MKFFLGTTLLLSILDQSTLWVANVGDSRGVLKNSKGEVIPLSFDHKPSQVHFIKFTQIFVQFINSEKGYIETTVCRFRPNSGVPGKKWTDWMSISVRNWGYIFLKFRRWNVLMIKLTKMDILLALQCHFVDLFDTWDTFPLNILRFIETEEFYFVQFFYQIYICK